MAALLKVNGVDVPCPSEYEWSLQDVSMPDSGRDEDGLMYKGLITKKVKIKLGWLAKNPAETAEILGLFQDEYFDVTYNDALENAVVTKTFYRGDQTATLYWWEENHKRYSKISFDIIER